MMLIKICVCFNVRDVENQSPHPEFSPCQPTARSDLQRELSFHSEQGMCSLPLCLSWV
uniref:Uncharacterized protein n=1 Tax=Anguilla anguilla TaxID=7936 RepID=A0A0E9TKK7_ANGAN